uniref:Uncharacterized protein n=1 Tax=Rhizophora mucronata TaxID=61149 RepID=A0A2P2NNP9_RHIMU
MLDSQVKSVTWVSYFISCTQLSVLPVPNSYLINFIKNILITFTMH